MDLLKYLAFWALILSVFGAFGALVYGVVKAENNWKTFAKEHHCVVVSKESGTTGAAFGVSSSGNAVIGTVFVPGKTGYKCDDGVVYYR